jgi:tetratricopeptide (TPR) repeat protein
VGPTSPSPQQGCSPREILTRYPGVREDHLRYLVKWGLIRPPVRTPTGPCYGFSDLVVIRHVQGELQKGVPFRAVVRALMAAREGQLSLDFRGADSQTAKVIAWERPPRAAAGADRRPAAPSPSSEQGPATLAFLDAFALDDGDPAKHEQALAAYRRALALDPCLVPAIVNLANIRYAREERVEAQALYERAIRLEPHCFEAHFNLGHVFHDLGRLGDAQACYRETLAINPAYADAHFYLAVTLEKLGLSQEARPHWRAYQQLAPDGEWVELAREFSE